MWATKLKYFFHSRWPSKILQFRRKYRSHVTNLIRWFFFVLLFIVFLFHIPEVSHIFPQVLQSYRRRFDRVLFFCVLRSANSGPRRTAPTPSCASSSAATSPTWRACRGRCRGGARGATPTAPSWARRTATWPTATTRSSRAWWRLRRRDRRGRRPGSESGRDTPTGNHVSVRPHRPRTVHLIVLCWNSEALAHERKQSVR